MKRILVVYGTTEGHTRKIAEFIGERLRSRGHVARVVDSASSEARQVQPVYEGVVMGGSLHQGKHQSALAHFIRENAAWINGLPNAFFSVSLSMASSSAQEQQEARALAQQFVDETGLNAGLVHCVAGALLYTKYDYFKRYIMRRIAEKEGGEIDTSQDHEYTDWDDLAAFVDSYLDAAGMATEKNR